MPELPKRRTDHIIQTIKKDYNYSEIINEGIDISHINAIIFSASDLSCDMTTLINFLKLSSDVQLKFKDFESALFIDCLIKNPISNKSFLIDDGMRIDRSYMDLTQLRNIKLNIPLNYLMWGVKFNESIDTYCFLIRNPITGYINPTSINGNEKLSLEDWIKIRKKIEELAKLGSINSQEKVLLISDFIQSCTQYIDGYQSESSVGTFITPDFPDYDEYRKYSGLVETVLNHNNGICMGISNLSTLLLNNDVMDVETESVYGCSHVWNKVLIDGKYYYFDNTWSITRSETPSKEGLITLSFSRKYLFFGQNTALNIGHHKPDSVFVYDGVISEEDLNELDYESQFEYQKKPMYRSFKK